MIEKRSLIESLPKQGKAILNYDDELVMKMKTKSKAKVISYGLKPGADLSAKNIKIGLSGTSFKLVYNGSVIPIRLKLIGYSYVKAALAAAAVGLAVGMDIIDVVSGLSKWGSLPGRMNLIPGKNEIMIIDDSYNASPDSVVAAIATLKAMSLGKRQKVAILGSMWELGRATEAGHVRVGLKAAKFFDKLIVVQENRHLYEKGLKRGGMKKENIYSFATTDDLLAVIDDIVKPNNLVFVKGSQGKNRLERAVYRLMRDKQKATGLLVRQSQEWKKSVK